MSDVKDKWRFRDRLINGMTEEGHFRIAIVKANQLVDQAREKHQLNPLTSIILGRLMIAAALSTTALKGEERISFRFESDGPINMGITEANALGEIRAYLNNPHFVPKNEEDMLQKSIGKGLLHFTKVLYGETTPYTSSVELQNSDLIQDIAYFYDQSEQIPSALDIDIVLDDNFHVKHAYGLLIQAMPDASEAEREKLNDRIRMMPKLSYLAEQGFYIDQICEQVLGEQQFIESNRRPIDFFCSCSKERFRNALLSIEKSELEAMAKSGSQKLNCHYCNKEYIFTQTELKSLLISQN